MKFCIQGQFNLPIRVGEEKIGLPDLKVYNYSFQRSKSPYFSLFSANKLGTRELLVSLKSQPMQGAGVNQSLKSKAPSIHFYLKRT